MLLESAAIAAPFGLGKLLDVYTTVEAKQKAAAALRRVHTNNWPKFVSRWSWWVYTRVFGKKSSSKRFIIRSGVLYFLLCLVSFGVLYVLFPTTSTQIRSVWQFGTTQEQLWWLAALLTGAPLYILANAQTLYFLEILKTSPNFFKFLLVAYADLLITASVALFGLPLLMLIYSHGAISSSQGSVDVLLQFNNMVRSPVADTLKYLKNDMPDDELLKIVQASDKAMWFEVSFEARPTAEVLQQDKLDRQMATIAIKKGLLDATVRKDGSIAMRDERGITTGYRPLELKFTDKVYSFETLEKITPQQARDRFCKRFPKSLDVGHGYMVPTITFDVSESITEACLSGKSTRVSIPVKFNYTNVDFGGMYLQLLYLTLTDLIDSVRSGFGSYLNVSPYAYLRTSNGTWEHQHMMGEQDQRVEIAFDEMLLQNYFYEVGGYNWFVNRSFAGGTVNFAIMSTAAFTIIVMTVVFLLFPIVKVLERSVTLSKWISLDDSPFGVLGATVTAWLALVVVLLSLA